MSRCCRTGRRLHLPPPHRRPGEEVFSRCRRRWVPPLSHPLPLLLYPEALRLHWAGHHLAARRRTGGLGLHLVPPIQPLPRSWMLPLFVGSWPSRQPRPRFHAAAIAARRRPLPRCHLKERPQGRQYLPGLNSHEGMAAREEIPLCYCCYRPGLSAAAAAAAAVEFVFVLGGRPLCYFCCRAAPSVAAASGGSGSPCHQPRR